MGQTSRPQRKHTRIRLNPHVLSNLDINAETKMVLDRLTKAYKAIDEKDAELAEKDKKIAELELDNARKDEKLRNKNYCPLTGLHTREYAEEHAPVMLELFKTSAIAETFSVIYLDVDHFKAVNDTHPLKHTAGDLLLIGITDIIKIKCSTYFKTDRNHSSALSRLREEDLRLLSRRGGDEFVLYLLDVDGATLARELCESIASQDGFRGLPGVRATVSIGCTTVTRDTKLSILELIQRADDALGKAKVAGRNGYAQYTREMAQQLREC